jgi:hypothetical protein
MPPMDRPAEGGQHEGGLEMKRALLTFASAGLALGLAGPAVAAEAGRYVLKDVDGGFIRLDTANGTVSHCRSRDGHWRCEMVADAQDALEDEIGRLAEENGALKQRLAQLEAELQAQRGTGGVLELPSAEDLDRVMGFIERFMRRFIDFARGLSQDQGRET